MTRLVDPKAHLEALPERERAVLTRVAAAYHLSALDLLGRRRSPEYIEARWAVMRLLADAGENPAHIARTLGRCHSTVVHGLAGMRAVPDTLVDARAVLTLDLVPRRRADQQEAIEQAGGERRADLAAYLLSAVLCWTRPDPARVRCGLLRVACDERAARWCAELLRRLGLGAYVWLMERQAAAFAPRRVG